jgi:AhpD family alkylhydroperoxidase
MNRLLIEKTEPAGIRALYELQNYLADTLLTRVEQELIKIRASQINGCAFCINMHTVSARKNGETEQRLSLICVWSEATHFFTDSECVLLKMTEEITLIHQHGLSDVTYELAIKHFGEVKTTQIIMAIIIINSWNRLSVSLQTRPEILP